MRCLALYAACHQPVPAELWDSIKEKIEHEDQVPGRWEALVGSFKGLFVFPRLVPVFASLNRDAFSRVYRVKFNTRSSKSRPRNREIIWYHC